MLQPFYRTILIILIYCNFGSALKIQDRICSIMSKHSNKEWKLNPILLR